MADPTRAQVWGLVEEMARKLNEPLRDDVVSAWVDRWIDLFAPAPPPPGPFRTGRKLGRTIYNDDEILIGVMDTPELGAMVVDALNQAVAPQPRVLWEGTPRLLEVNLRILNGDGSQTDVHSEVESGSHVRVVIEDTETPDA